MVEISTVAPRKSSPASLLKTAPEYQVLLAGMRLAPEYVVLLIGMMERRWRYFVAPIAITLLVAFLALKLSPTTYTVKALLLIQSANRPAGTGPPSNASVNRQMVVDQISALETWLKSDEVVSSLLPRLVGPTQLLDEESTAAQIKLFRANLSMELIGGSAVEMRFDGSEPAGLASKLEIILNRLMEGLTQPEKGILKSQQFIELRRREALVAADTALSRAIAQAGLADTETLRGVLKQINDLKLQQILNKGNASNIGPGTDSAIATLHNLRATISSDARVLAQLEPLYAEYHVARAKFGDAQQTLSMGRSNYVGIFESPENLLIVGRPQDPIFGERRGKKIAIAAILLSIAVGTGLLFFFQILEGRLLTTNQFEAVAGLPVIARVKP